MKFPLLASLALTAAWSAEPDGTLLYTQRCAVCHDSKEMERVPSREELKKRTPESVVDALTKGVMREPGKGLSEGELRSLAKFVSGKDFTIVQAPETQGKCEGSPPAITFNDARDWNGWGRDPANTRFQPNPGLAAADVPKLKLK